jgi:hypothetical protein
VGDEHESDPELRLQRLELDLEVLAELRVKRAERFVEQQHARLEHERARQRHPLLLAAGELIGLAVRELGQVDELERLCHALGPLGLLELLVLQTERDVLGHVEVREQRVALEHGVDVAPARRDARDVAAVEHDPPARRLLEAGDHPQRRRLAAAGRSEQGEELASAHLEVDPGNRDVLAEGLRQFFELDLTGHSDLHGGERRRFLAPAKRRYTRKATTRVRSVIARPTVAMAFSAGVGAPRALE